MSEQFKKQVREMLYRDELTPDPRDERIRKLTEALRQIVRLRKDGRYPSAEQCRNIAFAVLDDPASPSPEAQPTCKQSLPVAGQAQPPLPTWAEVRSELTSVLTGGNHLADALIHYLGAGEGFPLYTASHEQAEAVIKDMLHYDLWCCWRSIMHMREALLSRIPEGR